MFNRERRREGKRSPLFQPRRVAAAPRRHATCPLPPPSFLALPISLSFSPSSIVPSFCRAATASPSSNAPPSPPPASSTGGFLANALSLFSSLFPSLLEGIIASETETVL